MSNSCGLCGIRVLPETTRGRWQRRFCCFFCAWGGAQLIYESMSILHSNHIYEARQGQIQYKQSFQQAQLRWICSFHQRAETAGHVAVVGRTQPPGPFRRVCFVVLVSCFYRWETGCQKKTSAPAKTAPFYLVDGIASLFLTHEICRFLLPL